MNSLFVLLIIIIIFAILYLYYRNKQYEKILESFDNTTQNSLSTFFQNTVDEDKYQNNRNVYNGNRIDKDDDSQNNLSAWDGIWHNIGLSIYILVVTKNNNFINI